MAQISKLQCGVNKVLFWTSIIYAHSVFYVIITAYVFILFGDWRNAMNNKRGGAGAKILLVLILMIASAVGGAYGYRVLDGKLAVRDAKKDIESVRISDYDTVEATSIQSIIDNANRDLETATTRKEVYEVITDFNTEVAKVQTKTQKELEEARRAAEEAKNKNNYNNNDYNNNNNNSNNYNNDSSSNYNDYNSNDNTNNSNGSDYNSNSDSDSDAITNDDGSSGRTGIFGNILGGSGDN